jgi:sec-independent protein translocase protein TatC
VGTSTGTSTKSPDNIDAKSAEDQGDSKEESSMSFLEHLDELRSRLIRCAVFIGVAFILSWAFSGSIYRFLEKPVIAAMFEAKKNTPHKKPDGPRNRLEDLPDGTPIQFTLPADMVFGDSIIPAGTSLPLKVQRGEDGTLQVMTRDYVMINEVLVIPPDFVIPKDVITATASIYGPGGQLVVPTVQGAFNLYIKVSFYSAIFFGVPFILVQAWGFISPGLYPHEKKYAGPFLVMASGFFLAGAAFAYYIAFPRAANYLLGVATEGNLRPLVNADDYFDLIMMIMLGLGVVFEIPTITFFMSRLGLVTPRLMLRVWRYALVVILILAAVLSPTTDVPNLMVFAAPMLALYFLSVGIAWFFYRKREAR